MGARHRSVPVLYSDFLVCHCLQIKPNLGCWRIGVVRFALFFLYDRLLCGVTMPTYSWLSRADNAVSSSRFVQPCSNFNPSRIHLNPSEKKRIRCRHNQEVSLRWSGQLWTRNTNIMVYCVPLNWTSFCDPFFCHYLCFLKKTSVRYQYNNIIC